MKSYLMILGRQPKLGLAELQRRFGIDSARLIGNEVALLETDETIMIDELGGTVKSADLVARTAGNGWLGASKQAVKWLEGELSGTAGKVTLGISAYGFAVGPRDVGKSGLVAKARLKNRAGSVRLVPNDGPALSSAQTFHNKFGTSPLKRELVIVSGSDGHAYIGDVTGVQDIDAYTLRDRRRPKRDALNGMLPPKLAQIMINLAAGESLEKMKQELEKDGGAIPYRILDPFCGTGVILQEGVLMGATVCGTDINYDMAAYSHQNMNWFYESYLPLRTKPSFVGNVHRIHEADATSYRWKWEIKDRFISVVSETYLGEPMAQQPTPEKLAKVMAKCDDVIRGFLTNIGPQLKSGTSHCIAVPAWRIGNTVKHLPVVDDLGDLGYNWIDFKGVERSDLLYYREDQVVARELLVLTKKAEGSTKA